MTTTPPLPIKQGGTSANNATDARNNLIPPGTYIGPWTEAQIIYVGKHGDDAYSGELIPKAKLTIQAASAAAVLAGAGAGSPFVVCVLDAGIYDEALIMAPYVMIYAPMATILKSAAGGVVVTGANNTTLTCRQLSVLTGQIGYVKSDAGIARLKVEDIICAGTGIGVLNANAASTLIYNGDACYVENGFGVGDGATDAGHVHVDLQDIYLTGTGVGLSRTNNGYTEAYIGHILNSGPGGAGTAIHLLGGTLNLNCLQIETTVAWNLGAGTALRGTLTQLSSGTRTLNASAEISLEIGNYGFPRGSVRMIDHAATGYAVLDTDGTIFIDTTAGVVDVVLPAAANRRFQRFELKWILGAGAASASVAGGGTIDGVAAYNFPLIKAAITVMSDDVEWKIV